MSTPQNPPKEQYNQQWNNLPAKGQNKISNPGYYRSQDDQSVNPISQIDYCIYFLKRICNKGDKCKNRHVEYKQMRSEIKLIHHPYKKHMCKLFVESNKCPKYKHECLFAHGEIDMWNEQMKEFVAKKLNDELFDDRKRKQGGENNNVQRESNGQNIHSNQEKQGLDHKKQWKHQNNIPNQKGDQKIYAQINDKQKFHNNNHNINDDNFNNNNNNQNGNKNNQTNKKRGNQEYYIPIDKHGQIKQQKIPQFELDYMTEEQMEKYMERMRLEPEQNSDNFGMDRQYEQNVQYQNQNFNYQNENQNMHFGQFNNFQERECEYEEEKSDKYERGNNQIRPQNQSMGNNFPQNQYMNNPNQRNNQFNFPLNENRSVQENIPDYQMQGNLNLAKKQSIENPIQQFFSDKFEIFCYLFFSNENDLELWRDILLEVLFQLKVPQNALIIYSDFEQEGQLGIVLKFLSDRTTGIQLLQQNTYQSDRVKAAFRVERTLDQIILFDKPIKAKCRINDFQIQGADFQTYVVYKSHKNEREIEQYHYKNYDLKLIEENTRKIEESITAMLNSEMFHQGQMLSGQIFIGAQESSRQFIGCNSNEREFEEFFKQLTNRLKSCTPSIGEAIFSLQQFRVVIPGISDNIFFPIQNKKVYLLTVQMPTKNTIYQSSSGMFFQRTEGCCLPMTSLRLFEKRTQNIISEEQLKQGLNLFDQSYQTLLSKLAQQNAQHFSEFN